MVLTDNAVDRIVARLRREVRDLLVSNDDIADRVVARLLRGEANKVEGSLDNDKLSVLLERLDGKESLKGEGEGVDKIVDVLRQDDKTEGKDDVAELLRLFREAFDSLNLYILPQEDTEYSIKLARFNDLRLKVKELEKDFVLLAKEYFEIEHWLKDKSGDSTERKRFNSSFPRASDEDLAKRDIVNFRPQIKNVHGKRRICLVNVNRSFGPPKPAQTTTENRPGSI